ncbi:mechanosensitive ion channel family protein [Flaviflagellibacter deserti]|uniref:Mechanosensitive ion channel family protein n=1 Tax=Flaviflagellibacter deserti TaxID=2267266 RepID=A0ABV9Z3I9_9HYPH
MSETAAADDITSLISGLEHLAEEFVSGLDARSDALRAVPAEFEGLNASLASAGTSGPFLLFQIILTVSLVAGMLVLVNRWLTKRTDARSVWRKFLASIEAAALALVFGFIATQVLTGAGLPMRTLRLWAVVTIAGFLILATVRFILMASRRTETPSRSIHLRALVRDLSVVVAFAIIGVALIATLRLWNAGPGLEDLVRTGLVGIPAYLLFAAVAWRNRRTMAVAAAGPRPRSRWRTGLARSWPGIIIGFLIVTFLSTQGALTMGRAFPGSAVLLTGLMFVAIPHLDAMIGSWARRGLESPDISILAAAGRQTARFAVVIIILSMLATIWATPLADGFGIDLGQVARDSFGLALILMATAFLWNLVGTAAGRALRPELPAVGEDAEVPNAPRSRLGTLVPLLSGIGKASIVVLALLSVLVSIGVNVWPLITGLSIFGLAIGFGSQTLVKDVVSGLFFLIDDAFRFGEYIETSGAKGTVEKISVRSVCLRGTRGTLATVPYGQIGKIQNFSRDWVIEKLAFRVAFDTDVEKVRKIIKKIGEDIAADPELAVDLLEPLKSKGIGEVEDGTLIIHAKFRAKAGQQSLIRRAALTAIHSAFRENGIRAVPKPLTANPDAA